MSTEKHTPGPWEIGTATRSYEVCTLHGVTRQKTEDGLGQSWVYVFPPRVINGKWHWPSGAEQFANARLIAAAPDLLASVKDAHSMLKTVEVIDGQDGDPWSKAMARMEAAIAKAEGR